MTDKATQEHADESNTRKPPDEWTTGDEPMTGAQRSYLKTLAEEAKVDVDEDLTKAEASKRIDTLQELTGRGAHAGPEHAGGARSHAPSPAPGDRDEGGRGRSR